MTDKILIIEDDLELRNNLEVILRDQGLYVTGVGSAEEFYRIIQIAKFGIVIVDIGLPDKDNFELIEYLHEKTSCKIIILSARESVEDRISGYGAGADIYFVKPVPSDVLIAAISNILSKICAEESQIETPNQWVFEQNNGVLIAPNNKRVILTYMEGLFIATIMGESGKVVSREGVFSVLDYDVDSVEDNNSLNVLVSRIRRKCRDKCELDLPVTTHRNRGYIFEEV